MSAKKSKRRPAARPAVNQDKPAAEQSAPPAERADPEWGGAPAEQGPKQAEPAAAVPSEERESNPKGSALRIVLFFLLLFLAMTVQTLAFSVLTAAVALALSLGKTPGANLSRRAGPALAGLLAFLVLCTVASLYTSFGSYAITELSHYLAAGSLALLLLARGRREDARGLLWGFSAVCAVVGLLCLDMACGGPLFRGFSSTMAALGSTMYQELQQVTYTGARMNGIFNNANLTGSLTALGMLAGLYLNGTGKRRAERLLACLLTGLSAVAFLAAMSRGAILCFAAALVVYLFAVGRGERLPLFFSMLCLGVTMAVFGTLSVTLLAAGNPAGTWVALPAGVLLWLLWEFPGRALARLLEGKTRWIAAAAAVLAAAGIAAVALAFSLTGPYVLTESNFFTRGADVTPGESYTLSGDWDGAVSVVIYGSTLEQELTGTTETYYNGPLEEAAFTVPDGVERVLIQFRAPEGGQVRSVSLSDGTELPMAYTLLPENIVGRLQKSLFQDSSFLLRVQYVKDGWTLFTQAPLAGHGLGATEGLLTSVQPFFYESLYLHNHLLQVMDETGLLGLAAFLALLLGCAWLLVRRLRQGKDPLAAVLLACWAMMNLHGLMEITFSVRMYQCAALVLLALIIVCYQKPLKKKWSGGARVAVLSLTCLWLAVTAGLILGSQLAQREYENLDTSAMTVDQFMNTMDRLDLMDCYTDQDYKVNLMVTALQRGEATDLGIATRCARELLETGEYDACYKAAAYYCLPLKDLTSFFFAVQTGLAQERSNSDAWNSAFHLFSQAYEQLDETLMEDFVAGLTSTGKLMDEVNQVLLVDVALTEENQSLLELARAIEEQGVDGQGAYFMIGALLGGAEQEN